MALFRWLGDDSWWYVHLAAIWHWYLPLGIQMMCINFVSVFSKKILDSGIDKSDGIVGATSLPQLCVLFFEQEILNFLTDSFKIYV